MENRTVNRTTVASSRRAWSVTRTVAQGLSVLLGAAALTAVGGEAHAVTVHQDFTAPGSYTYTVPAGVNQVSITAAGAGGGRGGNGYGSGGVGGLGAQGTVTVPVEPGDLLTVAVGAVGGAGGDHDKDDAGPGGASPSGGGGSAGTGSTVGGQDIARGGGGGGGATTVLLDGSYVIAAGGGGGGGGGAGANGKTGGAGGDAGIAGANADGAGGGSGGSPASTTGTSGGSGGDANSGSGSGGGGGGGGGVTRGGSGGSGGSTGIGGGGGGGGGSSLIGTAATQTAGWSLQSARYQDGSVTIRAEQRFATTTSLSLPTGVVSGQPFKLGLAVGAQTGGQTPTGSVTVTAVADDETTTLGTATLRADGTADLRVPGGLPSGAYALTASYAGDGSSDSLDSSGLATLTIASAATVSSVTLSSTALDYGDDLTATAHVGAASPGAGTPTGEATFTVDGLVADVVVLDGHGEASTTIRRPAVGSHTVAVSYAGDTHYLASATASASSWVVNSGSVTVGVRVPDSPSRVGAAARVVVSVAPTVANGDTPTGAVQVLDRGLDTGNPVQLDGGSAVIRLADLPRGTHLLSVRYDGDSTYDQATSAEVSQIVGRDDAVLSLTTSGSPVLQGKTVTFTARAISASTDEALTQGSVRFTIDGEDVGPLVPVDGDGVATLATTSLTAGAHTLVAVFEGSTAVAPGASATLTQRVAREQARVSLLNATAAQIHWHDSVTFVAHVTGTSGGHTPTGRVVFLVGGVVTQVSVPLRADGTASVTLPRLGVGRHTVTARYLGDATLAAVTSPPAAVRVIRAHTTVALRVSDRAIHRGQRVTLRAKVRAVNGGSAVRLGWMTFYSGKTWLGRVPVSATGVAKLATSRLTRGRAYITAVYRTAFGHRRSASAPYFFRGVSKIVTIKVR